MGIRMNRCVISGCIKYNMFVNQPCWCISNYGYQNLLARGFHPHDNPWPLDSWEHYLFKYGYLKCEGIPTNECQYEQLNFESLYDHLLN